MKEMAIIEFVFVPTASSLRCNTTRAQERITPGSSSGFASISCGACKEQRKNVPIFKRASNCVDLEHSGFERSGRILGRCTRTIPSDAERSRRFRVCSTGVRGGGRVSSATEEMEVMEGDVVEYPLAADPGVAEEEGNDNGRRIGVGVIVDLFEDSDAVLCLIEPLCQQYLIINLCEPLISPNSKSRVYSCKLGRDGYGKIGRVGKVRWRADGNEFEFQCYEIMARGERALMMEKEQDPRSKEWIQDELQPETTVPIGQVRVLQAWYSQRMVPDRISNPHGEHAENLWILE